MSSLWLRRLIHVGLTQQTLQGLGSLAEVIAQATGMSGLVLWEEGRQHETPPLTVFAAWTADGPYGHSGFTPDARRAEPHGAAPSDAGLAVRVRDSLLDD